MKTLLAALLVSSGVATAAPTIYQQQNFSIEFPDGWQKADPPPKALALVRSPDGSKGIVIMAFRVSAEDRSIALEKLVSGAKEAAAAQGVAITAEQDQLINGLTFHTYSFTLPNKVVTLSSAAVNGDWVYSVQGFSGSSDPTADPEIRDAMHSFRLLSPSAAETPAATEAVKPESTAYRAGQLTGRIAIAAFVIGVLILAIQKRIKGKPAAP